jgi:hypothetical protein
VKIRKTALLLLLFHLGLLLPSPMTAQQGTAPEGATPVPAKSWTESYLVPEIVYVGDRARLVVHLGSEFAGIAPFTLEDPSGLARQREIRIHRLELDYRRGRGEAGGSVPEAKDGTGRPRLLVDFTPYSPGLIDLPPLPLGGDAGLEGLQVSIASILDFGKDPLVLSEPALPLSPPGAMLLILAVTLAFLLLFLGGTGGILWARKNLGGFLKTRRKRRLVALMRKMEHRLRRELSGGGGDYQAMLGLVSTEFRDFLGCFTGYNCLAMSAGEFFTLPPLFPPDDAGDRSETTLPGSVMSASAPSSGAAEPGGASLGPFFRNLDRLRYSGEKPETADVSGVLDDLRGFTSQFEKALRGKAAG